LWFNCTLCPLKLQLFFLNWLKWTLLLSQKNERRLKSKTTIDFTRFLMENRFLKVSVAFGLSCRREAETEEKIKLRLGPKVPRAADQLLQTCFKRNVSIKQQNISLAKLRRKLLFYYVFLPNQRPFLVLRRNQYQRFSYLRNFLLQINKTNDSWK